MTFIVVSLRGAKPLSPSLVAKHTDGGIAGHDLLEKPPSAIVITRTTAVDQGAPVRRPTRDIPRDPVLT